MRTRTRLLLLLLIVAVIMCAGLPFAAVALRKYISYLRRQIRREDIQLKTETGFVFPCLADIAMVKVKTSAFEDGTPNEFTVDESHWESLLQALSPSESDDKPCTWPILASLTLITKQGHEIRIQAFFIMDSPIGAFRSELDPRQYYRGGNSEELLEVLKHAFSKYQASRSQWDETGKEPGKHRQRDAS